MLSRSVEELTSMAGSSKNCTSSFFWSDSQAGSWVIDIIFYIYNLQKGGWTVIRDGTFQLDSGKLGRAANSEFHG